MVSSGAATVPAYLASLPPDRRAAIEAVRRVIRKHLPKGYEEGMQYGMISYVVPLSRYPDTYNGQPLAVASLGNQKNYMALYLMGVYGDPMTQRWFVSAYKASGKKLDMGKSCVRFRTLDDLPLDVIGAVIARIPVDAFVAKADAARPAKKRPANKAPANKAAAKRAPATKATAKTK